MQRSRGEAVWLQRPPKRERETRLSRRSAPYMPNNVLFCIHVYRLDSVLFFSCITLNTSVDMPCAKHSPSIYIYRKIVASRTTRLARSRSPIIYNIMLEEVGHGHNVT